MIQTWQMHCGDALSVLQTLPAESVNCIVTSPPYWALRDYGMAAQIGREDTPWAYIEAMLAVCGQASRVLANDGVLWLNLGDCYAAQRGGTDMPAETLAGGISGRGDGIAKRGRGVGFRPHRDAASLGLKHKDLIGMPWRVAFALQESGWYLRSDVIWAKPNPMPESVKDRPTKSHEYVFLLTKSDRYWYDADAIREKYSQTTLDQIEAGYDKTSRRDYDAAGAQNPSEAKARIIEQARKKQDGHGNRRYSGFNDRWDSSVAEYAGKHSTADVNSAARRMSKNTAARRAAGGDHENHFGFGANARTVWTIPTEPSQVDHFAVMPRQLARRCIVAGCPYDGIVLDPFAGVATTGVVALEEGRNFIGVELNPKYYEIARERLSGVAPLLATELTDPPAVRLPSKEADQFFAGQKS